MLNHSPPAHHLATIVLQDAGCTIVDLPAREGSRRRRRRGVGKCVAIATARALSDVKSPAGEIEREDRITWVLLSLRMGGGETVSISLITCQNATQEDLEPFN